MTKYIIAATILIVGTILVSDHIRQDREKEQRLTQATNDLKRELEQTSRRLQRSEILRYAANRAVDSCMAIISHNRTKLREKDREIAKIKGKYDFIPVDSLQQLMEQRAADANR